MYNVIVRELPRYYRRMIGTDGNDGYLLSMDKWHRESDSSEYTG